MRVTAASQRCRVELGPGFEAHFAHSPSPHVLLADQLLRAIQPLEAFCAEFDALFIDLRRRWERGFLSVGDDFKPQIPAIRRLRCSCHHAPNWMCLR